VGGGVGQWQYAGDADTTPASGKFSFNTSGYGSADNLYVHQTGNQHGIDMGPIWAELEAGDYVFVGSIDDPVVGSYHQVSGTPTESLSVWNVPLDGVDSDASSTAFSIDENCFILPLFRASGDVSGPGSSTDNELVRFDGTAGTSIQGTGITVDDFGELISSQGFTFSSGELTSSGLTLPEAAAPGTPATGKVELYAKTDGLLYSKDDAGTETLVSGGAGGGGGGSLEQVSLSSGVETVAVDQTEVVIGGGVIDSGSGWTGEWSVTGEYFDGGGGGTRAVEIRLYDLGSPGSSGTPDLRSTITLTLADGFDQITQALTTAAFPVNNQLREVPKLYEVRAYIDATGNADSVAIYQVRVQES
jgi:hypothetical protein